MFFDIQKNRIGCLQILLYPTIFFVKNNNLIISYLYK